MTTLGRGAGASCHSAQLVALRGAIELKVEQVLAIELKVEQVLMVT